MNRTAKIAVTIVVGIIIAGTATAFAYSLISSSQSSDSPLSYIPSNSSLVLWVNYNGTSMFVFSSDNSTAMMLNEISMKSGNLSIKAGNSTLSFPVSFNSTYGGFEIYSINLSNAFTSLIPKNFSIPSSLIKNVTLYLYMTDGGSFVIGSFSAIRNSINSFNSDSNFVSKASYINQKANLSFYYAPSNKSMPLSLAWGWANNTSFTAYIQLTNSSPLNFTGSLSYEGFEVKSVGPHEIEVTMEYSNLTQLYDKIASLR